MWQIIGDFLREQFRPQNMLNQLKDFAVDHAEQNVEVAKKIAEKAKEVLKKR